ncbi:hypothetical protein E1B28_009308 [Marasmius oreades]|uniref:NACHT domain-containing protein n=1 Tax=Marasmius oreades TaxID=181124 RepID=A0A9P7S050_9AGAR|nr:uncharacterized protein E1B28_009308 [Marasmius oreades]KAG7093009.1 hypothetical protein E1B28_009308 [Marasmius oreades]
MLIEEPCAQVDPRYWAQLPRLVIIDGVDECIDVESQMRLLRMIQNATPTLPLNFLILSRPEPHISDTFSLESFTPRPSRLTLGDFTESVRADIKRYLCHEFARIRKVHRHTLDSSLQASWPGDSVIDQLVSKATGQFIYAITIMKYIDTGKLPATPILRLDIILHGTRGVNSSSPYPALDLLYSQILQYCGHEGKKLREILRLIVSPFDKQGDLPSEPFQLDGPPPALQSSWALEQLLELSQGEATALVSGLHSILAIPSSKTEKIFVLHASFSEFLLDAQRSGVYYVGTRLSSQEWFQVLIPCQIRILSRFCVEYNRWFMQNPRVHGQLINGEVNNVDIGSLNVWKCLYDNWTTITVNDQITAALNVFDPHLYLTTILHCAYKEQVTYLNFPQLVVSRLSRFSRQTWLQRYHIAAVHMQISMFYSAYRKLLKISDKPSRICLQDFFTRCKSFFRGFYVSFPSQGRNTRGTPDKAVKSILFACQLSISRLRYDYLGAGAPGPLLFVSHSEPIVRDPKWMIRVLPSDKDVTIPARWEVKYIDAAEGRLFCKLLERVIENNSSEKPGINRGVKKIFESSEIEDWTLHLAQLDWKKTRKIYILGKLARLIQGKRVIGNVVFSEDESDLECQS